MAKKTFTVPKSATDTIVTVDIPDPVIRQGVIKFAPGDNGATLTNPDITWTQGDPVITQTPVVVEPPPVVIPPTGALTRFMDWESKFEWSATTEKIIPAKIGAGFYNTQSANAQSITNAVFPGTTLKAMKMTWQPGWQASSSYRSEIQSVVNPDMEEGTDVYIGFAWLAEVWAPSATWGQSIWQVHDRNGTSPPVSIHITDDELQLVIVNKAGVYRIPIGKFVVGKRYDFVFHFKFSTGSQAINEVWIDGVQKIPAANKNTPNLPATGGGYSKIGLNYFGANTSTKTPRIAYYGPYKVGKSYNDVKP